MTLLARAFPSSQSKQLYSRLKVPVRFSSGDYYHLPFAMPGNKKLLFGVKLTAYLATGFSIPFLASWYQLRKAGGG